MKKAGLNLSAGIILCASLFCTADAGIWPAVYHPSAGSHSADRSRCFRTSTVLCQY